MVASGWSSQQEVTSADFWLPPKRVMVSQDRTTTSLSRCKLTATQVAGQPVLIQAWPYLLTSLGFSLSDREDPSRRISSSSPHRAGQQSPFLSCSSQVSWPVSL